MRTSEITCLPEVFEAKRIHDTNPSKNEEQFCKAIIINLEKIDKSFFENLRARGIDLKAFIAERIRQMSYYYMRKQYVCAEKSGVLCPLSREDKISRDVEVSRR